ncbi:MAG: type 2 isopentenyl-diphosphate Delta-isomerase [Chloroflexi bacterium]|nr:type 2 isopentenyl-diphosphate Delta-isomerase [Chloroflexota bacterium]
MPKVTQTSSRKSDHIQINLEENVESGITTGLEQYYFNHEALPEIDLESIDLSLEVFFRKLIAPLIISSMTGGTPEAHKINHTLAAAAQETGIALGLGSQRAAVEDNTLEFTFQVRQEAPDILLFANLGAVQLNYGYSADHCQRAVDMVEADALILHLNPLQEALQPEGDTRFSGLLKKISVVCETLTVPVIAKEVGWGFSKRAALQLTDAGISAIDIAGAGGTSWSQVEMYRANDKNQAAIAKSFLGWGIPTAESIVNVRESSPDMMIFASGGLRNGLDVAKCIALGATLGGMAGPFLKAAVDSVETTIQTIYNISKEIQICMFASGIPNLQQLQQTPLIKK